MLKMAAIYRKHTIIGKAYPKKWLLWGKEIGNNQEMKNQIKTHSYMQAKFKFEECDFVGGSQMTIHLGKAHSEHF